MKTNKVKLNRAVLAKVISCAPAFFGCFPFFVISNTAAITVFAHSRQCVKDIFLSQRADVLWSCIPRRPLILFPSFHPLALSWNGMEALGFQFLPFSVKLRYVNMRCGFVYRHRSVEKWIFDPHFVSFRICINVSITPGFDLLFGAWLPKEPAEIAGVPRAATRCQHRSCLAPARRGL